MKSCMTGAIGSELGTEIEAEGRVGLEQSQIAARLGKGPGAGWLGQATNNRASASVSDAPSFRSSWQTVINASRVPRGTGSVEAEEWGAAGTTGVSNATNSGFAQSGMRSVLSTVGASFNAATKITPKSQKAIVTATVDQHKPLSRACRPTWEAGQNVDAQAPSASGVDATLHMRSAAAHRDRTELPNQHKSENTHQMAEAGAQTSAPSIEASISISVSPASPQASTPDQTAAKFPPASPTLELSDLGAAATSGPAQLLGADEISVAGTGTLPPGMPARAAAAGLGTRSILAATASIPHNKVQENSVHEAAGLALDDISASAASRRMVSSSTSETSAAEAQRDPSSAQVAMKGEGLSDQHIPASKADIFADSGLEEGASGSSALLAALSDGSQTRSGTVESNSKLTAERSTPRAEWHGVFGEPRAAAAHLTAAQPVSSDVSSSGLHNPAEAQVSSASVSDHAQISTSTSAASSAHDAFSVLDEETSLGAPTWIHAGGQHAEAGFRDPALGWVGVRADLSSSGIHATLVPDSTDAALALNGHLAGLTTHLVEQQSPVVSLSMASPSNNGTESGAGQHMQQSAQGNPQGSAPEEPQSNAQENASRVSTTLNMTTPAESGVLDSLTNPGARRGTRISVMA